MADGEKADNAKRQVATTLEAPMLALLDEECEEIDRDRAWVLRTALAEHQARRAAQAESGR